MQDSSLLNISIRENLMIGNKNDRKQLKELWEALKASSVYEEVKNMSKGFDTIVGEGGVILSGGHKDCG